MTIAEKLTLIAQNEQKVYNAGYEKGKSESGGGESITYSEGLSFEDSTGYIDFGYGVNGIGECTDTDIVIPPTYNGRLVTTILYAAFAYDENITSVVIPDSVLVIDEEVFDCCENLHTITVGKCVEDIYDFALNADGLVYLDFSKHEFVPNLHDSGAICEINLEEIKVRADLIDEFKTATNWSSFADYFVTKFSYEE